MHGRLGALPSNCAQEPQHELKSLGVAASAHDPHVAITQKALVMTKTLIFGGENYASQAPTMIPLQERL